MKTAVTQLIERLKNDWNIVLSDNVVEFYLREEQEQIITKFKIMNELQLKANVLAYCRRNGKINDREINSMMIPENIIKELVNENQLVEAKPGVYKIVNIAKVQTKGLF